MRPHSRGASAGGFTLLEMLITLMIVSLVAGVVWQAMGQLLRVERLLDRGQMQSLAQTLRFEWVRGALAALLPGMPKTSDRFQGNSTELRGLSTEAPVLPTSGFGLLQLRIQYDPIANITALQILSEARSVANMTETYTTLLSWAGRQGKFSYLDEKGQWQDTWPPSGMRAPAPALPRAVSLETGVTEFPLLLATMLVSALPLPTRLEQESQ